MKNILKVIGGIFLALVILLAAAVGYLTVREYRPQAVKQIPVSDGSKQLEQGDTVTVLTYNIGYGALSQEEDFFMDGGSKVRPDSKELVERNLEGITDIIREQQGDFLILQEVDRDSKRSYYIDQMDYLEKALGMEGMFACNFRCDYVPYPIPTIGKVESGLVTLTQYQVNQASRIALPESFSWPVKTCNLKRCMLETRIPIEGTDQELVLINFHLEAYDSGQGKIAQSRMLAERLAEEYEKGNYVIAGGDFNQTFQGIDAYPVWDTENWAPGTIGTEDIPEHFSFVNSQEFPTCRLLDGPYSGNYQESQVYVLDGFIISDNLTAEQVQVINTDFLYTDHQPVRMEVTLK